MTRTATMGTSSSQRMWLIEFTVRRMIADAIPSTAPEISCHASRGAPDAASASGSGGEHHHVVDGFHRAQYDDHPGRDVEKPHNRSVRLRSHYAKTRPDSRLGPVSDTTVRRRVLKVPADGVAEHRADLLAA